jgi:uncharacterized delta-60 repeat protein
VVTLTAVPNTGYAFVNWSGDLSGNNNPETLTMDGPKSVTANFLGPWAKSYIGSDTEYAYSAQQTTDGGYIVIGTTLSFGAGGPDFWVLKLASDGTIDWQKAYGGASADGAYSIQQTSDGGYIVAAQTLSFGAGGLDFWVLKLTSDGTIDWQKAYGGTGDELVRSICQTNDDGYIVAGATESFGAGVLDFWVLKLTSDGTIDWQKAYGGAPENEGANSVQQTSDGGYIVAGYAYSFGDGSSDFWVLKLDSDGTVAWQKTYGGVGIYYDSASSIQQTSDGGYIVAGDTGSFDAEYTDFWVLKLNSDGTVSWQKRYGGTYSDYASSIQQTSDGGYIVAGETGSFGVSDYDFWVLKLNSTGTVSWQKSYGGAEWDEANSIQQTSDGGYIVAGNSDSFGAGDNDFWVLKLKSDGTISFDPASGAQVANTNAVPADTDAVPTDTAVTGVTTSATVTDTNATVTGTNATIVQQAP